MDEHSLMEQQPYKDLVIRVGKVETVVDTLHRDNIRHQSALASIATHIDNIVETIHTIDSKLDQQRTKRPELAGLAAVAAIIISLVAAVLYPVFKDLEHLDAEATIHQATSLERAEAIGYARAERDLMKEQINSLEERMWREHINEDR